MTAQPRMPIESGTPDHFQYLHPVLKRNYGQWAWHERPRPGVLHHVAKTGDSVWTVRAGTQRQMDVHTIRKLCDVADHYADGFVRFTIRSNIEFMVADEKKGETVDRGVVSEWVSGRWHRQLRVHDLAYPGLATLRHPRHRRLRCGEIADGSAVSGIC